MKYKAEYEKYYNKLLSDLISNYGKQMGKENIEDVIQDFFIKIQQDTFEIDLSKFYQYARVACVNMLRHAHRTKYGSSKSRYGYRFFYALVPRNNDTHYSDLENDECFEEDIANHLLYNPWIQHAEDARQQDLRKQIEALSPMQKHILLSVLEGESIPQITKRLSAKYDTVKASFRHGYMKLREHYQEEKTNGRY
jgi:RNA polymerase sigma factor (sigma-70 family)